MNDGSMALALGAGAVAAVNPCGFALLPAYLSLLVLDEQPSRPIAVARALKATVAMTAGFAGVFGVFGLAVAPVAASVQLYLPGFTVVLGLLLVLAGGWVLRGHRLWAPRVPGRRRRAPLTRGVGSMVGFGASYAVASLGCTIAPFLAVVVTAFRSGSILDGGVLFAAYAAGMGAVVATAAVAIALTQQGLLGRLRRAGRFLPSAAGLLLIMAGGYAAWYGAWELRVLHGNAAADPVVDAAARFQQWLAANIAAIGAAGFAAMLAALVGIDLLTRHRYKAPERRDPQTVREPRPDQEKA